MRWKSKGLLKDRPTSRSVGEREVGEVGWRGGVEFDLQK